MGLVSWQTRTLATMIAGGYMVDGKKGNPALDMAMKLSIDELEAALMEDNEKKATKNAAPAFKEPAVGSFERFQAAFGGKIRADGAQEGGRDVFAPKPSPEGGD